MLILSSTITKQSCTQQNILASVASVYDFMGLVSPLIFVGRIIIQKACKSGAEWNKIVCNETARLWKIWDEEMLSISTLSISRCICPTSFWMVRWKIHTFVDASSIGYGACGYVRLYNSDNQVHCSLLCAKSRVSPLKPITVPRLELQAAVLTVEQCHFLRSELYWEAEYFLWSDPKIALG